MLRCNTPTLFTMFLLTVKHVYIEFILCLTNPRPSPRGSKRHKNRQNILLWCDLPDYTNFFQNYVIINYYNQYSYTYLLAYHLMEKLNELSCYLQCNCDKCIFWCVFLDMHVFLEFIFCAVPFPYILAEMFLHLYG